mgnify:CR=1 FL=1
MYGYQFHNMQIIAEKNGWTPFASMQNHYNLIYREEEREMLGLCASEGIGVIPWSPLARGRLARPWENAYTTDRSQTDAFGKTLYTQAEEADRKVVEQVREMAEAYGVLAPPNATDPTRPRYARRWMFYIGPDGKLIKVDRTPHTADAGATLVATLDALQVPKKK